MKRNKIGVGVIGAGFGKSAQIPGFKQCPDAEVIAICSGHLEKAEATAREFGIPRVFTDYREMVQLAELDLVSVVTPPYLHYPMVMATLEAKKHVLCEKPMAMNVEEATEMYIKAEERGVIHCVDHELRFNPTRIRIKELIGNGYLGRLRHVTVTVSLPFNADPRGRPWGWWSQKNKGGGVLGATGSHYIDLLRWWFGEIRAVYGQLSTFVQERRLADSEEMRPVETDDACAFLLEFATGAQGTIVLSSVAYHPQGSQVEAFGDEGTLILDSQESLWGAKRGESQLTELTVPDPVASLEGVAKNVWAMSFVHLARYLVEAIKVGTGIPKAATFCDGMQCQQVMDAVRRSWQEQRWIEVEDIQP
jgi:predicted dehydrogenase